MKSWFKFSLFTFMVITATFVACNKSDIGEQSASNAAGKVEQNAQSLSSKQVRLFRLDGVNVVRGTFSVDDTTKHIFLELLPNNVLVINGFTSQEAYFQYGDNNGYNLRAAQKIAEDLAAYAESSGAIAETEATGVIPKWWNDYFEDYMRTRVRTNRLLTRSITTDLWENLNGSGRNYTLISMLGLHAQNPWLWLWGMDNNISSYHPAQLVGSIETAFDRSFFRRRMFTFTKAKLASGYTVNLDSDLTPFDDRAGSWLTLGL